MNLAESIWAHISVAATQCVFQGVQVVESEAPKSFFPEKDGMPVAQSPLLLIVHARQPLPPRAGGGGDRPSLVSRRPSPTSPQSSTRGNPYYPPAPHRPGRQPLTCRAGGGAQNPKGAALTDSPFRKLSFLALLLVAFRNVKLSGAVIGRFLYFAFVLVRMKEKAPKVVARRASQKGLKE